MISSSVHIITRLEDNYKEMGGGYGVKILFELKLSARGIVRGTPEAGGISDETPLPLGEKRSGR